LLTICRRSLLGKRRGGTKYPGLSIFDTEDFFTSSPSANLAGIKEMTKGN